MKTQLSQLPEHRPGRLPFGGLRFLTALVLWWAMVAGASAQTFAPIISQIIPAEDNASYFDHEGDLPAVILIKNNGSVSGTISGWYLSDTPTVPNKWQIPSGTVPVTIGAGESLIVFASAKNRLQSPYATNFTLPCGSNGYLYNPQLSLVSQKAVAGENCPECIELITPNSISAWKVPTSNDPASTADWRLPGFSDTQWARGQPCLGYDQDPLMQNMVLYSVFDTGTVDTVNRTITDVTGPVLHTGTWPASATASNIGIPLGTLPKIIQNVGFTGPQNLNSYVSYPHHTELDPGTGGYTWSVWIRPLNTDLTSNEVILRKGMDSSTSNAGYLMVRTPTNSVSMSLFASGFGTVTATIGGGLVTRDSWHHILCTITRGTANTLTIYHNGVQRGNAAIPAGMNIAPSLPLYLARAVSGGAIMYTGRMDDLATWNRTLSPVEVSRIYEAGNAGKRINDASAPGAQPAIYGPCIQTNVQTAMKGVNTSLYERIAFTVPSPSLVRSMTFRVKYDDGFIAYINGVEIARRNDYSAAPAWNSAAKTDRPDTDALTVEQIPVPAAALSALVAGSGNVLAIHALNFAANDQRFLICPELCYDEMGPEDCIATTNGRLFWITFPGNAPEEASNPLQLSVCITGAAGTTGNVAVPGLTPPFSQNFTIPAGGSVEVALPKEASLEKSDRVENKGVRITASANVAVTGKTRIDYSTDTFLAHPVRCLGSSYLALCWQNSWNGLPDLNGTQFGIVAIADNTHVTIRPKVTTGTRAAGVAYNFVLNAGQTYMLRNLNNSPADLTGSEIISDSPVAVFGGHRCANVSGSLFFCDTVLEQTLPVSLWNTQYVIAPLAGRTASELVRVVAAENATTILINGVVQAPALNKGDVKDYTVAGGALVSSSKKFLASHISRSSDADGVTNADPFILNAQPVASWLSGYRFCTPPATQFSAFHVNVVGRSAEIAGVVIGPAAAAAGPVVAIGATGFSYRQLTLTAGTTYTTSGPTHGLEIYGWGEYDSYGHSGGMAFGDTQPPTLLQCPPDITIFTSTVPGAGEVASVPDVRTLLGVIDNCCPERTVLVAQSPLPGSLLPAGDYQLIITATDCNKNSVTCVIQLHVRTDPRQQAFSVQFGNPSTEATIWGWDADPDGDQLTNEQEYMLGTSMAVASQLCEAFSLVPGPNGTFDASLRIRNDDPSIDYSLEGSFDLGGWFGGLGHFDEVSNTPDTLAGYSRIQMRLVEAEGGRRMFIRLKLRRN